MKKSFLIAQAGVRTLGIAATLIAIVFMVTSKESNFSFGFQMDAKYNYSVAFKFSVVVNAIASFISVLSLSVFVYHVRLPNPSRKMYYLMFLLDLAVVMLIVMGTSAAATIGYLGRYGNSHAGWTEICDQFTKFCNRVQLSISMSCLSGLIFLILSIWASWKATTSNQHDATSYEMENNPKIKENKIGSVSAEQ